MGKKVFKTSIKVIEWALIIFITGCLLLIMTQLMFHEEPSLFGYNMYTVLTDSMQGTIDKGSVIICEKLDEDEKLKLVEGDIITFIAPKGFERTGLLTGKNVTHRIVKGPFLGEDEKWYVHTKGDNAQDEDLVDIPLENIKAKVVLTTTFVTKLMTFIGHWYGFLIVIVIPLLGILIWQILSLVKAKENEDKKKIEEEKQLEIEKINKEQERIEEIKKKAIEEYIKGQNK